MLRIMVVIIFGLFNINSFSQSTDSCVQQYKISEIPQSVKKEIRLFYKTKLRLANPDEKFQATDVIEKGSRKERRLIFWTQCLEEFIIVYEHGGYAYHKHLVLMKRSQGQWSVEKNILAGKVESINQVKEQLKREEVVSLDHI